VLRPAVLDIQFTRDPEFPSTYNQLLANSRSQNGTFLRISRLFSAEDLSDLERKMRQNIEDQRMDWARGFFFGHQIRGIKAITKHLDVNAEVHRSPEDALYMLVDSIFEFDALEHAMDNFYIDVGMELYEPRHSLHWRRASHAPILTHLMPALDADTISSMATPGADGYFEDISALLRPVSGFRYTPKQNVAAETGIFYLQCYSTDKSVADSSILNHNTLSLNLADGFKGDKRGRERLAAISARFSAAHAARVMTAARIEIRIPLAKAAEMLQPLPQDFLKSLLIRVRSSTWW